MKPEIRVGVLALQGDFLEHEKTLRSLGAVPEEVRYSSQLKELTHLVIPGGESTTIGKLMAKYGFLEELRSRAGTSLALYGTCAGMILMAREVSGSSQTLLGLMDIRVTRNAYGRQDESFEAEFPSRIDESSPLHGIFIRAPRIDASGAMVETLAEFEGCPVLVRQGRLLASSFHPELTADTRVHEYFLGM